MEEQQLASLIGKILAKSLREEINKIVDARLADSNIRSLAPSLTARCCEHKCIPFNAPHSVPSCGRSPEPVTETYSTNTQETPTPLASHSSCDMGTDTLNKAEDLPRFETNCDADQQYCYDNDDNTNDRSSNETDSDEEKGHMRKVTTNGSAPHQSDTAGTVTASLARDAPPSIVDLSPTEPDTIVYNHPSSYEFPNGNIVETIQFLTSDQDSRAKFTGWALLPLQSFKALVRKNCDVKVCLHAGILKAQSGTFQTLLSLKKKKLDCHTNSDNEERVNITEKICFGVYKCPKCEFSERPRLPNTGKNRNSIPRPPVGKCTTHPDDLEWKRCSASAVIVRYHGRMKTEIHHRGTHNHPKPPPMRAHMLAWRELEARVNVTPNDTAGKTITGSRTQKTSRRIHVAQANVDRLAKDVKTISNKHKPKGSIKGPMTIEKDA